MIRAIDRPALTTASPPLADLACGEAHGVTTSRLQRLEAESIFTMREVVAEFRKPAMLYSIGKDSSVLLHEAPEISIDTLLLSAEAACERIIGYLQEHRYV